MADEDQARDQARAATRFSASSRGFRSSAGEMEARCHFSPSTSVRGTLLRMWRRYLSITLLLVSVAFAQDRFVVVGANVLRVSRNNSLIRVLQLDPVTSDLRFGSSDPRISPDQHWIAYIKDHNAWLRPTGAGKAIRLTTAGTDSAGQYLSVEAFLIGFTPDSSQLMYSIAPGKDECPDCKHPEMLRRKADYGFFLYDLRSRRVRKQQVPESTRVFDIVASDRFSSPASALMATCSG